MTSVERNGQDVVVEVWKWKIQLTIILYTFHIKLDIEPREMHKKIELGIMKKENNESIINVHFAII